MSANINDGIKEVPSASKIHHGPKAARLYPRSEGPYVRYDNPSSAADPLTEDNGHSKEYSDVNRDQADGFLDKHEDDSNSDSDSDSESDSGEDKPSWTPAQHTGQLQRANRRASFEEPIKEHEDTGANTLKAKPVPLTSNPQNDKAITRDDAGGDTGRRRPSNHVRPLSLHLPGTASSATRTGFRRSMDEGMRRGSGYGAQQSPHNTFLRTYPSNVTADTPFDQIPILEHDPLSFNPFTPPESHHSEDPTAHRNLGAYPTNHNPSGMPPVNPHLSPYMANANPFAPYSPLPAYLQPARSGQRPPPTGHELLAKHLTGRSGGLKPMYRRFEALNHRLLLHLQDEICELEEQLNTLDAADTQERLFPGGVHPASRRPDNVTNNDIHFRRTNVLGDIGYKLATYSE